MACVLSMRTIIYSSPCGGYGGSCTTKEDTADATSADFDYNWISTPSGANLPESANTCACKFDSSNTTIQRAPAGSKGITAEENKDEMNLKLEQFKEREEKTLKPAGIKRKLEQENEDLLDCIPPKRISPYLNTPKERKEERRRVLKLSVQKLRQMEDPEHFLRRTVLINNTLKKVQKEIREEKQKNYQGYKTRIYRLRPCFGYDVLNNSYLPPTQGGGYLNYFDDPFASPGEPEKVTDEITNTLLHGLKDRNKSSSSQSTNMDQLLSESSKESSKVSLTGPPVETSEILNCADVQIGNEKQICSEMDTVFNNLIRALGET